MDVSLILLPFLNHATALAGFGIPHDILLVSPNVDVVSFEEQSKNCSNKAVRCYLLSHYEEIWQNREI